MDDSRRVATLVGVLFGIASMGSSSAAIALAPMAQDLGIEVSTAVWTISLYVLMLGVTTALYGRISDLVGVRAPLAAGVGMMTAGAMLAALAPGYELHLVGRLVQGAGAAAVPTLGVVVLTARYDGPIRSLALGRLAGMAAVVGGLGPLGGGLVEATLGWRGVMAVPMLGLLVLPWIWHALDSEGIRGRLDVVGACLVALAAAGLVLLVQSPSTDVVFAVAGCALLATGVPAVVLWVRREPGGFLPLVVVRNGTLVRSAVAAAALPAGWFALLVAAPAVLVLEGWEPWQVGLLLVPGALTGFFTPRLSGRLIERLGASASLAVASVGGSLSLVLAAVGVWQLWPPLLTLSIMLNTACFSLGQPALLRAVGDSADADVRGVALGVAMLLFLTGGSVGSAVVGGLNGVVGYAVSLLVLAALPLLAAAGLQPDVRAHRRGPRR
ncbi:MFS transporter [Nocardioides sp. 616]|uniref:MFS transporter n=1 Tax=Nocardioides sp. 616 TaxID=2268090 RepID=UPI000CE4933E|nr:MFS transporter [Nocardioides sp. 616]